MFKNLSTRAIGIQNLPLAETIALARDQGFAGIDLDIREAAALAGARGVDYVRGLFSAAGVRPGQWPLPVAWSQDDRWEQDLEQLPRLAALGRDLGCTRTCTVLWPGSDQRPHAENYAWHLARLRPIARVLADQGCRLGVEFLGPKTLRARYAHEFIFTLGGLRQLAAEIGTGNVGVLLDSWHLYTSGGSVAEIGALTASDVVAVHVNDAPRGLALDEYIDTVRTLPLETGVIDLVGFMRALAAIGYDGPVTVEPFSQSLNQIAASNPSEAARITSASLDRLWQAAGLA